MQSQSNSVFLSSVLALAAILSGCSKSGGGAAGLDPAQVPVAVSQAFDKSPEDTKQSASNCVAALQDQDMTAAFLQLQQINEQSDLTPQQRTVVAKAMQTTFK